MTTLQFPTTAQLTMLCTWMTNGAEALDEPALYAQRRRARRNYSLRMVKQLTERLQLPDEYHAMRKRGVNGSPLVVALDPLLRERMYQECRRTGYILRDGAGLPPLSPYQMYTLHLLSWGETYRTAGMRLGRSAGALSVAIGAAKRTAGCVTVGELIACAFRNEWLPTHRELIELSPTGGHGELFRTPVASPLGHAA